MGHVTEVRKTRAERAAIRLLWLDMSAVELITLQLELAMIYLKCMHMPDADAYELIGNETWWRWYVNHWEMCDDMGVDWWRAKCAVTNGLHLNEQHRDIYRMNHLHYMNGARMEESYAQVIGLINKGL